MDMFRLICYGISHVFMMGFLIGFSRLKYTRRKTAVILGCSSVSLIILEILGYRFWNRMPLHLMVIAPQILILQGSAFLISDFRDSRTLFTGLMASNYVLPGTITGLYLYRLTEHMLLPLAVEVLIHLGILCLLIRFLRPMYLAIQSEMRDRWLNLCLMPTLFYISAMGLDLAVGVSEKEVTALFTMLFFLMTMNASYFLVFRMIEKLQRGQQELSGQEILRASIHALKREQEEILEIEQRIAADIQDKRHLVRIMQEMLFEKNYDGVRQTLDKMQEMTAVHCPVRYCENTPVNGVMVYYAAEAEKSQIAMSIRLDLPEKPGVDEWGLAVMLGNLMDNAIRSCRKIPDAAKRSIQVTARLMRGQILLEVRNSCDGYPKFDSQSGLPISDQGENHGIGLRNVVYFAEKNRAVFDCGVEQGEFFARILI